MTLDRTLVRHSSGRLNLAAALHSTESPHSSRRHRHRESVNRPALRGYRPRTIARLGISPAVASAEAEAIAAIEARKSAETIRIMADLDRLTASMTNSVRPEVIAELRSISECGKSIAARRAVVAAQFAANATSARSRAAQPRNQSQPKNRARSSHRVVRAVEKTAGGDSGDGDPEPEPPGKRRALAIGGAP